MVGKGFLDVIDIHNQWTLSTATSFQDRVGSSKFFAVRAEVPREAVVPQATGEKPVPCPLACPAAFGLASPVVTGVIQYPGLRPDARELTPQSVVSVLAQGSVE